MKPKIEQNHMEKERGNFMKNQMHIPYKIPHMKTIKATAERFHLSDHFVRCAVKGECGHLFSVMAGTKYLVNCEFTEQTQLVDKPASGVRPIPVHS